MKNDKQNYEDNFNYEYNDDAPISMGTMAKLCSPFIVWGLIVFAAVALKTSGVVAWEWLWVTSTLWIPAALVLVSATAAIAYEVTRRAIDYTICLREEKNRIKYIEKTKEIEEMVNHQSKEKNYILFTGPQEQITKPTTSEKINTLISEKESLLNNDVEKENIKIYKKD